jgi:shikimate kinase
MSITQVNITKFELPYKNLVLTGFVGVGKSTVGRSIARQLDIQVYDVDEEIELRELMSIARIRELYGDARLKALEHEACRNAALMRRTVIVVPGAALLDARNYRLLTETGIVVVLTCELGEALRRLHMSGPQRFRDQHIRERTLARLHREHAVVNDTRLLQLDTTRLTLEQESTLLLRLWLTGTPEGAWFRYGPPPPLKPPQKPARGLATPKPVKKRVPPQSQSPA